MLRTSIDLMKKKTVLSWQRKEAENIPEEDYADDIALLANAPAQAESLPYILERAAGDIGLHGNADKSEYMCSIKEATYLH